MDIPIDDDLSYYPRSETRGSLVCEMAHEPTGEVRGARHVSSIGERFHTVHFSIPDLNFNTTIPDKERVLVHSEDEAMWLALRHSSKIVSKGRLISR